MKRIIESKLQECKQASDHNPLFSTFKGALTENFVLYKDNLESYLLFVKNRLECKL